MTRCYFTVGSATTAVEWLTLPGLANYFGLHWGTMDTYNSLTLSRGGVDLFTLTGDQFAPDREDYVNIFATNPRRILRPSHVHPARPTRLRPTITPFAWCPSRAVTR